MNKVGYVLHGVAKDIETIARLRPWMEDEVKRSSNDLQKTKLITDYDSQSTLFSFKILFFK